MISLIFLSGPMILTFEPWRDRPLYVLLQRQWFPRNQNRPAEHRRCFSRSIESVIMRGRTPPSV